VDTINPGGPPKRSALTIITTGNTPMPSTPGSSNPIRYMFYDAPLEELDENPIFTPDVSPMASASFSSLVGARWVIPRLAKERIQHYVKIAHDKKIAVRITKPIDFPTWIRCAVTHLPNLNVQLTSIELPPGTCIGKCC